MEDKLCFVQFVHPGGEHEPDHDYCKHWNFAKHRRKFLRTDGGYRSGQASPTRRGEIVFWGEWEPESQVSSFTAPLTHGPRFLHEPYYSKSTQPDGQNTDPFVFGRNFLYTECRQHTAKGPTQLRYLTQGSVVLFGSCLERSFFALDTVFVVDDHVEHDATNYKSRLKGIVSEIYKMATIDRYTTNKIRTSTIIAYIWELRLSGRFRGCLASFPACQTNNHGLALRDLG